GQFRQFEFHVFEDGRDPCQTSSDGLAPILDATCPVRTASRGLVCTIYRPACRAWADGVPASGVPAYADTPRFTSDFRIYVLFSGTACTAPLNRTAFPRISARARTLP